jgi:hypothetical protein
MGLFNKFASLISSKEEIAPVIKPERNEPCWCGSGKKYKKCHLIEDDKRDAAARAYSVNCGPT